MPVGRSLVEDDKLDAARDIMARRARRAACSCCCRSITSSPPKLEAGAPTEMLDVGDAAIGDRMGLDIGPADDRGVCRGASRDAKTVVWNGPMGVFEIDAFAPGTNARRARRWRR